MAIIKKMLGKTVYGLAKGVSALLDGLIYATETMVLMAKSFLRGCALLISMGGCLFILLLIGPLGTWLLMNPGILALFLVILFLPIMGALFIAYLKYLKFITTAYLFHLANYWMDSGAYSYRTFASFKQAYRQAEEDRINRERQRRYEQQREWEERFRQWHQQSAYGWQGGFNTGGPSGTGQSGYGYGPAGANPYVEFQNKYRRSCEILGVTEDADQYRIKLAYRKKAKAHHPDVNHQDPDATRKFQEINEAYEFLNEDNIQRYKQMAGRRA